MSQEERDDINSYLMQKKKGSQKHKVEIKFPDGVTIEAKCKVGEIGLSRGGILCFDAQFHDLIKREPDDE